MAKRIELYRALFFSDQHMSNNLPYARPSEDGRTDRLEQQLDMWRQVREYARAEAVNDVYSLGDLFDKAKPDPVTLSETTREVALTAEEIGGHLYILPGNHEGVSLKGERFTIEALRHIPGVSYMDKSNALAHAIEASNGQQIRFWAIEYAPVSETMKTLEVIESSVKETAGTDTVHVLLFHNSVVGCEHLAWVCDDGIHADKLCRAFDHVIGGHFHTHQKFGPTLNGMYCGAPMQHNFGDSGEVRGFWDIRFFSDGTKEASLVPVQAPVFWLADPGDLPEDAEPGDYVRWNVEATPADFAALKGQLQEAQEDYQSEGYNVDFKHKPIPMHSERIVDESEDGLTISIDEMISRYVKSPAVETGDIKKRRLIEVGRNILEAARRAD